MELRQFGRTGLDISVLTFGCGAVGGLMTRGEPRDQDRAVKRALELGINHFDTAPSYGDGTSEENLGRALKGIMERPFVSTKVRIAPQDRGRIAEAVAGSLDASLNRLRRDSVDLFQLHNPLTEKGEGETLTVAQALDEVVPALERARQQGKARFIGFTAVGETAAIHRLIDSGAFDSAQIPYNVLNPSAGGSLPARYPAQDYGRLLDRAEPVAMGSIGIRVLAGGALSGTEERHPLGAATVAPIGSGSSYADDVRRALRFEPLLREGYAASLPELALRFAIANKKLTTTEIGLATIEQLKLAVSAIEKGPLPEAALKRIAEVQATFAGEAR